MAARQTDGIGYSTPNLIFHFWLIFSSDGSMRMSRTEPACSRDEHRMKLQAILPKSLWKTPSLSATIELSDPGAPPLNIDVTAAQEALRTALGVDVDVRVVSREGE
jgi:hypothetical protein